MKLIKIISSFLLVSISTNILASSACYTSTIHQRKHWVKINEANGDDAEPKAKQMCEEDEGVGKCKLIYKTDYGGYGAIAIGNKSNGYSKGASSQKLADFVAMRNCKINSIPSTCRITSRWHDEGKTVIVRENAPQQGDGICGINGANGMPISCATGLDQLGNPNGYNNGRIINPSTGQPARY
jgi:hypothetical protein